jgi:hypothetical protein
VDRRLHRVEAGLAEFEEPAGGQVEQRRLGRVLGQGPPVDEQADQGGDSAPRSMVAGAAAGWAGRVATRHIA